MDKYGPTINWALTGSLPSGVTFTRTQASPQTTTAIGSDGLLKYFNANEPRFDHDPVTHEPLGLLIESQRQNVFLNSDTPATQNISVTAQVYTLSFYGTGRIALSGTHTATVTGTGAYPSRKTYSFTPTAGTLTLTVSGDVQKTQLEAAPSASSHIPTTGTAVTRAADRFSQANPTFMNPAYGTFLVDFQPQNAVASPMSGGIVQFVGANPGTDYFLLRSAGIVGSDDYNFLTKTNNVIENNFAGGAMAVAKTKAAVSYKAGAVNVYVNGASLYSGATYTPLASISTLFIGDNSAGIGCPGHYKSFKYWNRALSNAELQRITT